MINTVPSQDPINPQEAFVRDPIRFMADMWRGDKELAHLESNDRPFVFAFAPDLVQQILSRADIFWSLALVHPGPRNSSQRRLSMSLIGANGTAYKKRRRIFQEPLKKSVLDAYLPPVIEVTEGMLDGWQPGEVRDIYEEMHRLVLRITCGVLFGLDRPDEAFAAGDMLDEWLSADNKLGRPGTARLDQDPDAYDRLLQMAEETERHLLDLVGHKQGGNDVLSLLNKAILAEDKEVTEAQLVSDLAFFFAAAHKTTATGLTWTLFLLAQHPQVLATLLADNDDVLQGETARADQLDQLQVLDRVIKESMRLLPPVPCLVRYNPEPVELAGRTWKRDTLFVTSQYFTHRDERLFPQPNRFDPDRWLSIRPSPYEYFPFGAGPRMCLGAAFSVLIMKTALSMILQRYRLSVVPGTRIDKFVSFVLEPNPGMPMSIHPPDHQYAAMPVTGDIHESIELLPDATDDEAFRAADQPAQQQPGPIASR